jgi:hypothetical protein
MVRAFIAPLGALLLLAAGGCATAGPNHVYLATAASAAVRDLGPPQAEIAGAVAPGEQVLGLAYDYNTDHLFLRIAPAQVIRVIERPSGKILREMPLPPELQTPAPADLAIRSSDRHLFVVHPDGRSVVELTLSGAFVRRLEFAGPAGPVNGLACDQRQARLLVLTGGTVRFFSYAGRELGSVALHGAVRPVSLGYDSDAQHYFVPLADGRTLGEFDAAGNLLAGHPADGTITAVDAGARSFVRVF